MESEKRYGYSWSLHCICDRKDGSKPLTVQEVRDRLNALEAERDRLLEVVDDIETQWRDFDNVPNERFVSWVWSRLQQYRRDTATQILGGGDE